MPDVASKAFSRLLLFHFEIDVVGISLMSAFHFCVPVTNHLLQVSI